MEYDDLVADKDLSSEIGTAFGSSFASWLLFRISLCRKQPVGSKKNNREENLLKLAHKK